MLENSLTRSRAHSSELCPRTSRHHSSPHAGQSKRSKCEHACRIIDPPSSPRTKNTHRQRQVNLGNTAGSMDPAGPDPPCPIRYTDGQSLFWVGTYCAGTYVSTAMLPHTGSPCSRSTLLQPDPAALGARSSAGVPDQAASKHVDTHTRRASHPPCPLRCLRQNSRL